MKKYAMFFVVVLALLVVAPFIMLAQSEVIDAQEISLLQMLITSTISVYVISFVSFTSATISLTSLIGKRIDRDGWFKQRLSWVISISLALVAYLLDLGIFEPLTWWESLFVGMGGGLVANGIYDIPHVKRMLLKLGIENLSIL
jgi:hypothetical protein